MELDNFVKKFYQLWNAGQTAHLDVDTHAGKAWVGLRVQLSGPVHHQHHPSHPKQRSPAYRRRQERRQAARNAAEKHSEVVNGAEEATNIPTDIIPEEATLAEEANEADVVTIQAGEPISNEHIGVIK